MALTRGERKVVTTASSVANRMGVVPAVSDDPLGTIGETLTKKLDFFAQRAATREEIKYKADVDVKSYKMIQELGRKHFDDPQAYTQAVDAYTKTLVEESPNRFKNWTKGKVGIDAAKEGENIINRKIKKDHIATGEALDQRIGILDEQALIDMRDMPLDKIDTYLNDNFKVKLGEIYKDMTEYYNSSYPDEQQQFIQKYGGTPDEWLRKKQLGFEQLRVNNWIKHEVDNLMTEIAETNAEFAVGHDLLNQMNGRIKKKLLTYLNKPDFQPTDGNATFTGSTTNERAGIIEGASQYLEAQIDSHKKLLGQYEIDKNIEQATTHTETMKGFIHSPEDYTHLDEKNLIAQGVALGLGEDTEAMKHFIDQHTIGQLINYHSDFYMPKWVGLAEEPNLPSMDFETMINGELYNNLNDKGLLDGIEGDNKVETLKQLVINQNLKKIFNVEDIRDLNLGKMDFYERDMRETIDIGAGKQGPNPNYNEIVKNADGENIENRKLSALAAYAKNLNEPIPAITNFLNSAISKSNFKSEEGLDYLDKAAYLVHYFSTKEGFPFVWKNINEKSIIAPLKEYHKLRQFNTSLVTRETLAEDFFARLNMDNTVKGEIKTAIDGFIKYDDDDESGDINLTKMINKAIKNDRWYQKHLGGLRSYETGVRFVNNFRDFLSVDKSQELEIDNNKVKQIIRPILDVYITSAYKSGAEVTEQNLREVIEDMLKYTLDDFEKEGFYWRGR